MMAHNTGSEHDMTKKVPDSTATLLSSSEALETSCTSPTPTRLMIRDFLRHTRLQILGKIFGRFTHYRQEPRKVAIYGSHRVAAFHCLLHMVPLGGAITLLFLRWSHYWIGDNPPNATTLQFVAKFHELLMQVSLVEIVLCIVRSEATRGFVPLGAFSGAMQATQLSYLWSQDFLSIFTSNAFRGRIWSKVGMIIAIPALFMLTALVGPSSAILMIPEPGCSKHENTTPIFMAPNESLYPAYLDSTNGPETNMASLMEPSIRRFKISTTGWRDYQTNLSVETTYPDPDTFNRALRLTARKFELGEQTTLSSGRRVRWSAKEATSIQPTSLAHNVLAGTYSWAQGAKANLTLSVTLPAPVTTVICISPDLYTRMGPNDDVYYVMKDGVSVGSIGSIGSMARRVNGSGKIDYSTDQGGTTRPGLTQRFDPIWLNAPEAEAPASIVVLFTWFTNATEPQSIDRLLAEFDPSSEKLSLQVTTCRVSAYWNTAKASLVWNQGIRLPTETGPILTLEPRDVRNITLNTTSIDMLHNVEFAKSVHFMPHVDLAARLGFIISSLPHFQQLRHTDFDYQGRWQQWGYNLVDFKDTVKVTDLEVDLNGSGYTTYSTSVRLSLAVILAYCTITIAYLGYILVTGSTSTAWNSAIELVALALQSKKPEYQGCTAVGIDSLKTFKQGVGIRVNGDNELELVSRAIEIWIRGG